VPAILWGTHLHLPRARDAASKEPGLKEKQVHKVENDIGLFFIVKGHKDGGK